MECGVAQGGFPSTTFNNGKADKVKRRTAGLRCHRASDPIGTPCDLVAEWLHGPSGVVVAWKTGLAEAAAGYAVL